MAQRKPIPGWEGLYEVSDEGDVFSVARVVRFADGRVRSYPAVQRKLHIAQGYLKVTLKAQGRSARLHVHVLVAATFLGPRPEGMEVCHNDGVKTNCHAANLRYDTSAGNKADRVLHGTACRGEYGPGARLTTEIVRAVRQAEGPLRAIAKQFGLSLTHVFNLRAGKRWAHLENS